MSVQIIKDIEESLAREVRRITYTDARTKTNTVLQEYFDPMTGELVKRPIDPDFYASKADTKHINYPHFFIKALSSREDIYTGRGIATWSDICLVFDDTSPRAYEIILAECQGFIDNPGNEFRSNSFLLRRASVGNLIRLTTGNNVGTYIIEDINFNADGNHTITVSQQFVVDLPEFVFDENTRTVSFSTSVDLNTVKIGDIFEDSMGNTYAIQEINIQRRNIAIDGVGTPSLEAGAIISRVGDVFQEVETGPVSFVIMDGTKPVVNQAGEDVYTKRIETQPSIPVDLFYLIRIDSKEKANHRDVLNRIWEEYNPPRTALPVVIRTSESAESLLTEEVLTGGSDTITVEDASNFVIGDPVYVIDNLLPTKDNKGQFPPPFTSKVKSILPGNQLVLEDTVPDTFTVQNSALLVSNAYFHALAFHFVDHKTKDNEGAQYWIHELTYKVEFWVAKKGGSKESSNVILEIGQDTIILP